MLYGLGLYYDPTYILIIIGAVLGGIASARVNSVYSKYARYQSSAGMTGAQVAERLLHNQGIYDVTIEHISGTLTDHYDPTSKVLRLSDAVYGSRSVSAVGVAAHECGHAMQHAQGYVPLQIRSMLAPAAGFGSRFSWLLIIIGFIISGGNSILLHAGILLFCVVVLFQIVTLPVEFDASGRALRLLENTGILYGDELKYSRKVLGAAALTYVASVAASLLQLLRLFILFGRRND